jgi:predicted RND superfamily exporter protein
MNGEHEWRGATFGNYVLNSRQRIAWVLIATTVFMSYWAIHVPIATRFEDLFPSNHPNVQLYRKYRIQYGGAQTLALMLRLNHGDIFNYQTLQTIEDMNREVNALPGVNHNEVFSLASYRVIYARALPGTLASTPYMYPHIPANQQQLDELKNNVLVHQQQLANLVTPDLKGAMVMASFNEGSIDYRELFDDVQRIIRKHRDANTRIYASGAVMFAAWGYHYLGLIQRIFLLSFGLMVLLTFVLLGGRTGWWAPIATGAASAIWGVGFMSLMGYNFDPIMLVVPLILTARDIGHGIQWQGRYYAEIEKLGEGEKIPACVNTANAMLRPGLLAVLLSVAALLIVGAGDIPVLKQLGLGGAVWLGASLILVFVGQPVLLSFLPCPQRRQRAILRGLMDGIAAVPLSSGVTRVALIGAGAGALALGLYSFGRVPIGYQTLGTPLYRTNAKVNRDTAEIGKFVPTNIGWVVLDSPEYPSPEGAFGTLSLRMADDMAAYLMERGDVSAVLGFGGLAEKPMNQLLHNGSPKFYALPDTEMLSATLWQFFFGSSAPDEPTAYFANAQSARNTCIRLLLPDHTAARLTRVREDLDRFVNERVRSDPGLKDIRVHFIGGDAGLYLATNDVIAQINRANVLMVLVAILVISTVLLRSIIGGLLLTIVALMANLLAYTYMSYAGIGLTVDTVSVVSLGIGIGISYAVYLLTALREASEAATSLRRAITEGLRDTGSIVLITFVVMVAGLIPWIYSTVLFQNEMSILLTILMVTNLIAAILVLPAMVLVIRPRFLTSMEKQDTHHAPAGARAVS